MPSVSKKQQRFMGMVHKCKKTGKCASKEVAKTSKSMKRGDAEDFASTKHKGLPEKKKSKKRKVKESSMDTQKKLAIGFINDICDKQYASAKGKLATIIDEKIKTRIKGAAISEEPAEE